jgi:CheY-like chemotaxis protein
MSAKLVEQAIERLGILVVDENAYLRKLTRAMLTGIGAKTVYEAADGLSALDIARNVSPDVVLLDWNLPVLTGPQIMRIVRSPGVFANPNLPVIMLTSNASRLQVHEAMLLGVHEFLVKPTSPKALRDRLLSILIKPRPMIRIGKYYVPQPRSPIGPVDLRRAA